jgi:shikimate kinase
VNIVLIGPRGVGKSRVSRHLLYFLKRPLFELDELIVYEEGGLTIPQIVSKKGWAYFRDVEYKVVQKISKMDNIIIDCGGGIVVDLDKNDNEIFSERKARDLKKNGIVFFLNNDINNLLKKIKDDPNRPSLSTEKSFIEIMGKRLPFYERVADYTVNMNKKSKKKATQEILAFLLDGHYLTI